MTKSLISFFVLILLCKLGLASSPVGIQNIEAESIHFADCDTFVVEKDGTTIRILGTVDWESRRRIVIRNCYSDKRFSLSKEDLISVNGKPYQEFSEAEGDLLENRTFIKTLDGNTYTGTIVETKVDTVYLQTSTLGMLRIPRSEIAVLRNLSASGAEVNDRILLSNAYTRYFFGTNALSLRKGEGYYQNTWVLFHQFSYGISNRLSLGGGLIPLFLFSGTPTPIWGTAKLSLPIGSESFHLSAGTLFGTIVGEDASGVFGFLFSQATLGTEAKNLTVGVGYGFLDGELADRPAITISGTLPLGRKASFISENYILPDGIGVFSGGFRFYLNGATIDAALVVPGDAGVFIAFPWLGVSLPIHSKKR